MRDDVVNGFVVAVLYHIACVHNQISRSSAAIYCTAKVCRCPVRNGHLHSSSPGRQWQKLTDVNVPNYSCVSEFFQTPTRHIDTIWPHCKDMSSTVSASLHEWNFLQGNTFSFSVSLSVMYRRLSAQHNLPIRIHDNGWCRPIQCYWNTSTRHVVNSSPANLGKVAMTTDDNSQPSNPEPYTNRVTPSLTLLLNSTLFTRDELTTFWQADRHPCYEPMAFTAATRTLECWWETVISSGAMSVSDCMWKCAGMVWATKEAHEQLSFLISGNGSTIVRWSTRT